MKSQCIRQACVGVLSAAARPVLAALMLLAGCGEATAQQATERYIPIGVSPGISGEQSHIGVIVAVDPENRALTIDAGRDGERTVRLTSSTKIWLDRSPGGRTNVEGDYADCAPGRRAEVRYARGDPATAVWIKIESL